MYKWGMMDLLIVVIGSQQGQYCNECGCCWWTTKWHWWRPHARDVETWRIPSPKSKDISRYDIEGGYRVDRACTITNCEAWRRTCSMQWAILLVDIHISMSQPPPMVGDTLKIGPYTQIVNDPIASQVRVGTDFDSLPPKQQFLWFWSHNWSKLWQFMWFPCMREMFESLPRRG